MKALPDHAFSLWKTAAFLLALFFCFRPVAAQNADNPIISFHAENENLGAVLTRLASHNIMNLSYNATDPSFERKITYSATSKPIRTILEDILALTGHNSRKVGNHMVIFPSGATAGVAEDVIPDKAYDYSKSHAVPGIENRTGDTVIRLVEVPVVIRDTLRIVDVVTKTDTVTIRDTVFVERPVHSRRTRSGNLLRDVFRFEPDREDGWALSFSYAQLLAGYSYSDSDDLDDALRQVKDADAASLRNFSLGAAIRRNQGKFSFQAGARLTGFSNRFSYTDISASGGFFEIDTLDVFYTVINGQQVFTYITDSTWIPLDRDALTYDRHNRIGLLELQLGMDYTFYAVEDFAVYVQGAFNAGVPVWLSGSAVQNVEGYPATELDKSIFEKWIYGYQAGIGARYTLTNWTDIYGGLFYKRYLSPSTANHPLERRLHGAGLKIGLLYYL
jgi:hypothetical protein